MIETIKAEIYKMLNEIEDENALLRIKERIIYLIEANAKLIT